MSLANLLSVEQIIPEMKATERWAAIVELIDLLVGLGNRALRATIDMFGVRWLLSRRLNYKIRE